MPSNTSLYTSVAQSNVGGNNLTTLYNTSASQITTQLPYGNANVQRFLNNGTDGANTVQNIVANGVVFSQGANISNGNVNLNNSNIVFSGQSQGIITVANNISNIANAVIGLVGSQVDNLSNFPGATVQAGGITSTGGRIGTGLNPISSTTKNLTGGTVSFTAGQVSGNINTGRTITGGQLLLGGGGVVSLDANTLTSGRVAITSGQTNFQNANVVTTGPVTLQSGSIVPNATSGYNANTVRFGDVGFTATSMTLPSNGNIINIQTGVSTFGATFGVGVSLSSNTSNITINNINNPVAPTAGSYFIRTAGIGQAGGTALNNINNVSFGNVTTDNIFIGTGFWRYPTGSNISNVTANTFISGDIQLVTGHASNVNSVVNTYRRGNVVLNANAIVLQANATGNSGGTGTYTFYSNNTADLGNNVVANNFTGNLTGNLNITNVVVSGTITGNLIPSANVTYDLGNTTHRWRDIYLANNSIYLGNAQLSANGTSLVVDNLIVTNTGTNGIGNVASLALNGNSFTVLAGDGTFVPYTPIPPSPQDLPIYGRTQTINIYSLLNNTIPIYGRTQGLYVSTANNEISITGRTGNITVYL